MDFLSFLFGFITAFVLMGVVFIGGVAWWGFSYLRHKQSEQDKNPTKKAMRIAKKPPYKVDTTGF